MWTPHDTGVFLQLIETPESNKVIIKLVRKQAGNSVITIVLHMKPDGSYKLDFDPWSNVDVTSDGEIDEKDINAITQLALDFYQQTVVDSSFGVFLSVIPVDDPRLLVRIEVLDLEDSEQPEFDYFLNATSFDKGASFIVRRVNPHSGPSLDENPGLENLVKAFIKLKL